MTGALKRIDRFRFGSLKLRIAVLYTALFAAVMTAIIVLSAAGLSRFAEEGASQDLSANARVFDELLSLRAQQMRNSADVLANDFGFREAVATGDSQTIDSALFSLRDRSGAASAFVVGLDGSLLAAGENRISSPEALWYPLDAGEHRGVILLGDHLALAAAAPIKAPDTVGWLVIAQPLDASELERLTSFAAIPLDAKVESLGQLPEFLAKANSGQIIEHDEGGRYLYHVSKVPALQQGLEPRLVLRHSLSASLAHYNGLRNLLLLLCLGALALVIAVSWRVARTVTGPLHKLDQATRLIAEGREVSLTVDTDDEIGRLASSFNAMVAAIDERERRIVHAGLHDPLTKLPNRKLFTEQLDVALDRLRKDERLLIAHVDLDNFKTINETLGFETGDALLRDVAQHMKREMPEALCARLGSDEFAILIENIDGSQSLGRLADQIHVSLQRSVVLGGNTLETTASLGIAIAPGDGTDGDGLMKNAEMALTRGKGDARASYQFFERSLDEKARLSRQMEFDLRTALHEGQFELHFQPLYNLQKEALTGFEALVRWLHPERGMISPAEFIPLAENSGLIIPLGEWVVREACRQAAAWPDDLSVAVNVSPKQFSDSGLIQTVIQAIGSAGINPSRLELEITESIFIDDVEQTLASLHSLRQLGVRIALDDFGTGYSSLSYLRSFPFDKVKIDQSFVSDLKHDIGSHAVIRAITTLAQALGMETLAEGVEYQDQVDVLRREGCQNVQGFLYSRPLPGREIGALIDHWRGNRCRKLA